MYLFVFDASYHRDSLIGMSQFVDLIRRECSVGENGEW